MKQNFHFHAKSIPLPAAPPKSFQTAWGILLTFSGEAEEEPRKMRNDSTVNTSLLIPPLGFLMDRQVCSAQRETARSSWDAVWKDNEQTHGGVIDNKKEKWSFFSSFFPADGWKCCESRDWGKDRELFSYSQLNLQESFLKRSIQKRSFWFSSHWLYIHSAQTAAEMFWMLQKSRRTESKNKCRAVCSANVANGHKRPELYCLFIVL